VGAANSVRASRSDLVLMDQATEPVPPTDGPEIDDGLVLHLGRAGRRALIERAVGPVVVVVRDVFAEHGLQVMAPRMSTRSRHSRRRVPNHRSMKAFARGARTGVRMIRRPSDRNTSSKETVNLVSRSWIRKRTGSARSVRMPMRFRACWVTHSPVGLAVTPAMCTIRVFQLDEHEHVQPAEEHRVHRDEVARHDACGLRLEEVPPALGGSPRRRRHPRSHQHLPRRAWRDLDAEPGELTLDPAVAPGRVLSGQTNDQLPYLAVERRTTRAPVLVGPPASDGVAVPSAHRLGPNEQT
jgi:hypothetical protein